jgi:hypothetical protein
MKSGVSGAASGALKYLPVEVTVDEATGDRVYLDENGRRIRTTDMREETIGAVPRRTTPDNVTKPAKAPRGGAARATKPAVPGTRSGTGRVTEQDVLDFIGAMCRAKGKPMPKVITRTMKDAAKAVLKERIAQARKHLGE